MVVDTYEYLFTNTQHHFNELLNSASHQERASTRIKTAIDECRSCVEQGLNAISEIIQNQDESNVRIYQENTYTLMQLLTSLLKYLYETVVMSCSDMETFPSTTGHIILTVFKHCKESESIYGSLLKDFEKQLKELFRSCHEVQLIYLMILEKHFIFDLSEMEQLDVFIQVLNLNVEISEVVLSLDLKTMAEQWKALTALFEKYSKFIIDQNIYERCTKSLCMNIEDNIKNSMKKTQEEKLAVRSLKVSNFLIKILIKVHQALQYSLSKNYQDFVDLICYIKMHYKEYLEKEVQNVQLVNIFDTNITLAADLLIKELIRDKQFCNMVLKTELDYSSNISGYVLLWVMAMKVMVEEYSTGSDDQYLEKYISKLFHYIFPKCKKLFTLDIKFKLNDQQECGLYEIFILRCAAATMMLSNDQFVRVQRLLCEAIFSKDYFLALFASDLWVTLSTFLGVKIRSDQLNFLINTYIELDKNPLFLTSPPRIFIVNVAERIFANMSDEEKIQFLNVNSHYFDQNVVLWSVIKVRNVPLPQCNQYEKVFVKKLRSILSNFLSSHHYESDDVFINYLNVVATCRLDNIDSSLKDDMLKAWSLLCHINYLNVVATCRLDNIDSSLKDDMLKAWSLLCHVNIEDDSGHVLYVNALAAVLQTITRSGHFNKGDMLMILHVISTIEATTSLKIIFLNTISTMSPYIRHKYSTKVKGILCDIFKQFSTDGDRLVRNKVNEVIKLYFNDKCFKSLLDVSGYSDWNTDDDNCEKFGNLEISEVGFTHKCWAAQESNSQIACSKTSNNFEFADIDSLFGDEEPVSKKVKLDTDDILKRLELETDILCSIIPNEFSDQHRLRISSVYDKLKSIIS